MPPSQSPAPAPVRAYVAGIAGTALGLLLMAVYALAQRPPTPEEWLFLAPLLTASFVLQRNGLRLLWRSHRAVIMLDELVTLVGLLVLPAALVPAMAAAASAWADWPRRRDFVKFGFNVGSRVTAAGVAVAVYLLLEGAWGQLPAAVTAALASVVVCNVEVAGVLSLLERVSVVRVVLERFTVHLGIQLLLTGGVGVVIIALWDLHPLGLLALAPIGLIVHGYTQLASRTDRELRVHRRLGDITRELLANSPREAIAERVVEACGDLFNAGEARLTLDGPDGPRTWRREFVGTGSRPGQGIRAPLRDRQGGSLGELVILPPFSARTSDLEAERELLDVVAATTSASLENLRMLEDLQQSHRRLAESEAGLRTLIEAEPECVRLTDPDGRMATVNAAGLALLEVSRIEELADRGWLDFVHPEDRAVARGLHRAALAGERRSGAYRLVGARGSLRWVESSVTPFRAVGGGQMVLGVTRDVTARREAEERLERSRRQEAERERLSALGTLVAGVAHEINNPLQYMVGGSDLAVMDLREALDRLKDADPEVREQITSALESVERSRRGMDQIAHITRSLRQVARSTTGERAPQDVNELVEMVLTVASPRVGPMVSVERDLRAARAALVNGSEVSQVVLNLLLNAADAVAEQPSGTLRVATRDEGDSIVVEVADTGPGIPEDVQRRIFEPFYTTKPHGTGLGLSISYQIAESQGGGLTFTSRPGETRFTLRLPAAREAPEKAAR